MAVSQLNQKADVLKSLPALLTTCNAAKSLSTLLRGCLGPHGNCKMIVDGAGAVKITKDGNVLLKEMQIQHPIANMVARCAAAQDISGGDGTITTVLLIGEILKHAERFVIEGIPRNFLARGFEIAVQTVKESMDQLARELPPNLHNESAIMHNITFNALRTKLSSKLAQAISPKVHEAFTVIAHPEEYPIDLFNCEIMHLKEGLETSTCLVKGIVFDHGPRHSGMPKRLEKCFVLTINVSLEYEKSEVNSGFFYKTPEQREDLVISERDFTDHKVREIINLKRQVCEKNPDMGFVIFNMKGIDPASLDLLANENIVALRRIKRRNLERITLCCGGNPLNSTTDLCEKDLGMAKAFYAIERGDDKHSFLEALDNPRSCTILIYAPHDHGIELIKSAIRDALHAMLNFVTHRKALPGGGGFEAITYLKLRVSEFNLKIKSQALADTLGTKARYGVDAVAEALLSIPKALAANSGLDPTDVVMELLKANGSSNIAYGIDLVTGKPTDVMAAGIFDSYYVKEQNFSLALPLVQQLILVDEIIRAGKSMSDGKQ